MIPTAEQLEPLYAAALAYGKASVRTSEVFHKAGHVKTPAVKKASQERDRLYRKMDAAREAVNAQFPGLDLACPAPFVGFTGTLDSYQAYVEKHLPDYVGDLWAARHKREIDGIRAAIHGIPETEDYGVNDFVLSERALFQVTAVSPKRRKVAAVTLPERTAAELHGAMKRIDKPLADRLLALHKSRARAIRAAGLPTGSRQ